MMVRFISGFAVITLSTLGLFYIIQSFSSKLKLPRLYFAMSAAQLGVPLAWVLSPLLTSADNWHSLYTFELGLTLCGHSMVVV